MLWSILNYSIGELSIFFILILFLSDLKRIFIFSFFHFFIMLNSGQSLVYFSENSILLLMFLGFICKLSMRFSMVITLSIMFSHLMAKVISLLIVSNLSISPTSLIFTLIYLSISIQSIFFISFINKVFSSEISKTHKRIILMLFLTITLSLFLSLLKLPNKFHILFLALLPLLIYILLTRMIKLLQADSNLLVERKYSKKIEDIILSLRSKKHDFSNHLHVINHLFKSKRYEDLHIYLNELCADLDVSQTLIHLNNSSIAGLLQSKYEAAKKRNLSFHIEVKHLMPKTGMQNYELIQVIGNLLDNAFDAEFEATKNQDSIVPQVSVRISQLLNSFLVISVHNKHSVIPKHKHTLIFKEGYSTKYKHTGLGLASIKKVIDKAQGRLEVNSSEKNGTTFSIFIPIITDKIIEKEGGQVG